MTASRYLLSGLTGCLLLLSSACSDEFKTQDKHLKQCPTKIFDKGAIVFESILVCGTSMVPQAKIAHAANVAAQWLDNNQDGVVDNPAVLKELKKNKATLLMSKIGFSEIFMIQNFAAVEKDGFFFQDLYAEETNNPGQRDASQEEIHHLIWGAGFASVYPEVFDDQSSNSEIYAAWEFSDEKGYYQYDDPTCDDFCKTMEHLYKATAALLNSSSDLAEYEFMIKNSQELQEKHPLMMDIFLSEEYEYPKIMWPDGKYLQDAGIVYLP